MVKSIAFGVPSKKHSKYFSSPAEVLSGKPYLFLSEDVLLYQSKEGNYVVFTIDPKGGYTKEDYAQLPEGAPIQLLDGKLIHMPSPKTLHQLILGNIYAALHFFVRKAKIGKVILAPMDVHLDVKNIFQPDLLFLSNNRLDRLQDWVYGAPDLVVEILSEGTRKVDKGLKLKQYEKYGALEYWIIDPENKSVEIYFSEGNKFAEKKMFTEKDILVSKVVSGFEMEVTEIFETE